MAKSWVRSVSKFATIHHYAQVEIGYLYLGKVTVYRDGVFVAVVTENIFVDRGLKSGSSYEYTIKSVASKQIDKTQQKDQNHFLDTPNFIEPPETFSLTSTIYSLIWNFNDPIFICLAGWWVWCENSYMASKNF